MKCTPRSRTTTSESFVVCGPNPERRARRDRRMAWRVGERRWYEEREREERRQRRLCSRGEEQQKALVLWSGVRSPRLRFCSTIVITQTMQAWLALYTKGRRRARAEGCRREVESSFRLFRNVETTRLVAPFHSHFRSGVHARARLFAEYRRSHPLPFVSYRKYRDIVCERAHRKLFSQAFSHAVMWQNSTKVCTRFWVRKASLLNKTKDISTCQ